MNRPLKLLLIVGILTFSITLVWNSVETNPKHLVAGIIANSADNSSNLMNNATTNLNMTHPFLVTGTETIGSTDGKSVDVKLQISPYPLNKGDSKFKISFLQPANKQIQVHVDYDVSLTELDKEIYRASSITGQPLLHTAEGVITIPFKFDHSGKYTLEISVIGINFIPINTENIKFELEVN